MRTSGYSRTKTVMVYGLLLAAGVLLLQWLEYQYLVRRYTTEFYVVALCVLFTIVGIWVGHKLTHSSRDRTYQADAATLHSLGISERESQVLSLLAIGHSNEEIADLLYISLNTVKTHLRNLYNKLDVSRRTQAISRARSLGLVA